MTHVNNFERQLKDERILQQESKQSDDPEEVSNRQFQSLPRSEIEQCNILTI